VLVNDRGDLILISLRDASKAVQRMSSAGTICFNMTTSRGSAATVNPSMNAYRGPPMTLGNAAAARVRLIVWCLDCRHQVRPDPAEMAERLRGRDDRPGFASAAWVRQLWEPAGRFGR
jgi:hypothetical protein